MPFFLVVVVFVVVVHVVVAIAPDRAETLEIVVRLRRVVRVLQALVVRRKTLSQVQQSATHSRLYRRPSQTSREGREVVVDVVV